MRTAHWKAHLLPLLLLLSLYSISVCLAATCYYDEYVREAGPLNIATAKAQPTGKDWEPLRIVTSTKDLQDQSKYCINKDGSMGERGTQSAAPDCRDVFAAVTAEKNKILMDILGRATALHTDRLLVQRMTGPLIIPDFSKHEICKYFNVPADHHTKGVAKADMVLYVASGADLNDERSATIGLPCAKSAGGRPIAGALTFGYGNGEISRETVRLTAHQIAHALGFSYDEMKSRNMIVDRSVRSKPLLVAVVKSDKTKKMTQEHYGCPAATDMELEDGENNNKKLSHWERRNAKDELMAIPIGSPGTSFMGFYTALTMAAFEDLGYYKANFQMAEHMEYGYKAGCDFLNGKCMENGKTKWSNMFCDVPMAEGKTNGCTTDRLALGVCVLLEDDERIIPAHFQYFASKGKGGLKEALTDYCPVVDQHPSFLCTNSKAQGTAPGSLFSKNSMCLDGNALKVNTNTGPVSVDGVCAEISCEGGSVKVKYLGDAKNKWYDCPEGQTLTPSSTSDSFKDGKIKCPKYKEVCTIAPDGISLVEGATNNNDPKPGGKSKDGSSVPFGLISSVAFLVLSFAGYLIA